MSATSVAAGQAGAAIRTPATGTPATGTPATGKAPSPITMASELFVAAHRPQAAALGQRLGLQVQDPGALIATLSRGWREIADPAYADGVRSVTPGAGALIGVRGPLMEATHRAFAQSTKGISTSLLLDLANRLLADEWSEIRWFGIWTVTRVLPTDPERAWQLLRRTAREAGEWITVDTLAHPYGEGILHDPRRWAELEQLIYSSSRWERRLVGSTVATMPFARRSLGGRDPEVARRGLDLIAQLIGDREPDVQKALGWALRSLVLVDSAAVTRCLEAETETARAGDDGHRAWVIREALPKIAPETADRLRLALSGVRRRPNSPSTSVAAATAATCLAPGTAPSAAHTAEG